jgi:TetR/AcrR family tetracycline transcriptional repressor
MRSGRGAVGRASASRRPRAAKAPAPEPARLSREVIVDAYLRVVEAEGTGDITLRRLGTELGVDPTAVYRHFRDKDEILVAASDRLLYDATKGFRASGVWRKDLRALMLALRRAYLTHPHALLALQLSPAPMPHGSLLAEQCLGFLRQAGLSVGEAALVFEALEDYTIGAAIFDAGATEESLALWRQVYGMLPPEEFPNLTAAAPRLYLRLGSAFERGLDLMLGAIEANGGAKTGSA